MYLWTKNNREGLCDSNYDVLAVAATAAAVKLTASTNKYDRRRFRRQADDRLHGCFLLGP